MNRALFDILVCPVCKGKLIYQAQAQELICKMDKIAYPIREDMPVMLADEARRLSVAELERISS